MTTKLSEIKNTAFRLQNIFWVAIVLLGLTAYLVDFNGLYGQDSHGYFAQAKLFHTALTGGEWIQYASELSGYPLLGALLSVTGIPELVALRLLSFVSLCGSLWFTSRIIRLLYNREGTLFLLFAAVTQIYFVRAGFLVMSDMTATCGVMCTWYFFILLRSNGKTSLYGWVLLAAFLAIYIRFATIPLVLLPVLSGGLLFFRTLSVYKKWLFAGTSGLLITLFFVRIDLQTVIQLLRDSGWSIANMFTLTLTVSGNTMQNTVPNILYVIGNFFHLGFCACGLLLIPFYRFIPRKVVRMILPGLVLYLLILAGLPLQNYRFLVISHLLGLIVLYPAFEAFLSRTKGYKIGVIAGILICNVLFSIYSFGKTWRVYSMEREVVSELKPMLQSRETIYTFYVEKSLPSYGIDNTVYSLFSREYPRFARNAVVLYNAEPFAMEWKNQHVLRNWKRLTTYYQLDTLKVLTNNWTIYRIR